MQNDILTLLQDNAYKFSKGQRAIANYINSSYDKAAFMTAHKLGQTANVSESTVVRFANELGYDGYPEMQKAMQEMVLNRLTSVQRIGVASDRLGKQDVLATVLQADADKLLSIPTCDVSALCVMVAQTNDNSFVAAQAFEYSELEYKELCGVKVLRK